MAQYALLVGVESFQSNLNSIAFAENDVNDFVHVLIDSFEIPYENIQYLTNGSATLDRINAEISQICEKAIKGDRVILYFATHGMTAFNTTYLSAFDSIFDPNKGNEQQNLPTWIRIETLLGRLHHAKCNVLAFLDCCHSTQFSYGRSIPNEIEPAFITRGSSGEYTAVFAAAGENEEAHPIPAFEHGCWTYYLINALSGKDTRAFRGASRRITISSLQSYLKEKVKARVLEECNQNQTPYIWGAYSDDETIVELPDWEGEMLKIRDIYFGKISAEDEKLSAPDSGYFEKNFYDLNSICSILNSNNNIQIIAGNKGAGKTYVGEYLEASNSNVIYHVLGIPFAKIREITFAQSDAREKYVPAWTYVLYTILSCIIVQQNRPGAEEFHNLLTDIYREQLDVILQIFAAGKRKLFNKKLKQGFTLREEYSFFADEDNGRTKIDGINLVYAFLFKKYYSSSEPLYFLVDGLDEDIRRTLSEDQENILLDLLAAVNLIRQDLSGIRLILLFRSDLLNILNGESNLNKTTTARSCELKWLSTDTKLSNTPLYQLMEKRIATSSEKAGMETPVKLEDILPPTIKGTPTWEWILRLTTYKPRDIVSFFNYCQEFAGEERYITEDNLWDATRKYSEYLWKEFNDVFAGTALAGHQTELQQLFDELSIRYNLKANTRFNYTKFASVYHEVSGFADVPISDALKILYEAGLMCVHADSGTYFYFRENPIRYDYDKWKNYSFELHVGLWKLFHIW